MKQEDLQVMKPEAMPVAVMPSPVHLIQAIIDKGLTKDNADAFDKVCLMVERWQAKEAERQFAQAFCNLQNDTPVIQASQVVPNNDGTARFKFAPYASIMAQVQPLLTKHGFSVRFSSKQDDNRITMICFLMHVGGHSVSNEFTVRIGKGPPAASESQADGSAASYAQRGALCDALNICVRQDTDARMEGACITPAQAESLERRVKDTGSDVVRFLKFAQSKSFSEIKTSMYPALDAELMRRERTS
jgi:hypothetical protein